MTGSDDRWRRAPDDRDIVESGAREWPVSRRRLGIVILAAVALVAGLGAGYAAGSAGRPGRPASSRSAAAPGPAPAAGPAAITSSMAVAQVGLCSAQSGRELQLGVEIMNQTPRGLVLRRIRPVLPLGALQAVSQADGPCGQLPGGFPPASNVLPADGTAWFTVTFRVLVACPGPDPVQFVITFAPPRPSPPGSLVTSPLPGFADLSHVPYSGCPVSSS